MTPVNSSDEGPVRRAKILCQDTDISYASWFDIKTLKNTH